MRDSLIVRNRAGGVAGRRFELVSLDDGGDSATAALRARELARDPLVVIALHGPAIDPQTLRVVGLAARPIGSATDATRQVDRLFELVATAAASGPVDRRAIAQLEP